MSKNIDKKIKHIIESNPIAMATVDNSGNPNVIAVAEVKVVSDNQLIITDNFMKQTKKNLDLNNNVCLAVWNKDWEGYKIIGEAKYSSKGKWFDYVKNIPANKNMPLKGAILITILKTIKLS